MQYLDDPQTIPLRFISSVDLVSLLQCDQLVRTYFAQVIRSTLAQVRCGHERHEIFNLRKERSNQWATVVDKGDKLFPKCYISVIPFLFPF